ncbi:uncharacterized protein LOC143291278 [Babylonia areolata]|uniref:uncharacterized protein LOC143291278 n=1 Tax=Babylonia areolata TaxID=304850 RepID=UPI003FCFF715
MEGETLQTPGTTMEEQSVESVAEATGADAQIMEVEESDVDPHTGQDAPGETSTEDVEGGETVLNDSSPAEEQQEEAVVEGALKDMWRMRVCPIMFCDISGLRDVFQVLIKKSSLFEYRMSQHLGSHLETGAWEKTVEDKDIPWLPNEKVYIKPQQAATAGMMEMNVTDSSLVDVMKIIREANFSKKNRLRFELKNLSTQEVSPKPAKTEGETKETEDGAQTEAEVEKKEEEEEKVEEEGTKPTVIKPEEGPGMQVNFAVRLKPVKPPAFRHEDGYTLQPEDNQIFLSKVPEEVPDNVLQAIMLSEMVHRKKAEDGTCTATFQVSSPLGAQVYMELFEGILVNYKDVEMSTTLGKLYDAKKKHADYEQERREANEKVMKGVKRKPDSPAFSATNAKKAREEPQLEPVAQMWMNRRQAPSPRSRTQRARAWAQRGAASAATRAGLAGRGAPNRGRGVAARGGGGRGGGVGRGAPPPGGRGAAVVGRGGVIRSRVFMRGGRGTRGVPPARGGRGLLGAPPGSGGREAPPPRRELTSPRGWGGYHEMDDRHAPRRSTGREMDMMQEMALYDAMDSGYRNDRFAHRSGYDHRTDFYDQQYHDRYDREFMPPTRRRW